MKNAHRSKQKIVVLHNSHDTWLDRDMAFIREHYSLRSVFVPSGLGAIGAMRHSADILWADTIFAWFGSLYFLPLVLLGRLFGKRVIVVSGGFDVSLDTEIQYGAYTQGPVRRWMRQMVFNNAEKVLAVSEINRQQARDNAHIPEHKLRLVYHGFDAVEEVKLKSWSERSNSAVMICAVNDSTYTLKGIDHLISLAKIMPETTFYLMGHVTGNVMSGPLGNPPTNLKIVGHMKFRSPEFNNLLNDCKVVLQLSHHESFGCAVADATLTGCYPIVSNRGALPEVVSGLGSLVPHGDISAIKTEVNKAFTHDYGAEKVAAQMLARFPFSKRAAGLQAVLDSKT